ncbi:response regulator transcription factor [Cohnella thailandensis]|uniref:Response regulator transcription factor n=1 Tax=Cohnella thailandensis TaxID=557557 RepID=A0A841T1H5_9BACL|nr:response regulator transcription factor [Cohnella thailandensis]MBB6635717.1 response regulator transcription factor [Cohnella thailandensis]MBP1976093.1 DNA-binding response OmpR family regulator [Cohnella thailandensis]
MFHHILVVDNEPELLELVDYNLAQADLRATCAISGLEALKHLNEQTFDLVILDIMMDGMDGFSVLERIRNGAMEMPVILLSAKHEVDSKIRGFGLGADDYVTKPFSPSELVARVQAHLRRTHKTASIEQMISYSYGNMRLNPAAQMLYKNNQAIPLSATETKMLLALMKRPNQTVPKIQLFEEVWGHSNYDENSINVYMNFLRKKIEDDPRQPRYIQTVWGLGYLLTGEAE